MTKAPVMAKIRKRETEEGGADIDIVAKLKDAKEEVKKEKKEAPEKAREEIENLRKMME